MAPSSPGPRATGARMCLFSGAWAVALGSLGSILFASSICFVNGTGLPCALPAWGFPLRDALVAAGTLTLALGVGLSIPTVRRSGSARHGTPASLHGPSSSRDAPWVARNVGIAVAVAASMVAVLVLVPVPQAFSMSHVAIYDPNASCAGIDTSPGTTVSFHWSAASPTIFFVVSCTANQVAFEGNGTGGSGSFVSVGGVYQFGASCPEGPCVTADVVGTYTAPVLPL